MAVGAQSSSQSSIYGNFIHANICQTFAKFTLKMAGNTTKPFGGWAPPGPASTRGAYSAPPGPLAGLQGRGKEERERGGKNEGMVV